MHQSNPRPDIWGRTNIRGQKPLVELWMLPHFPHARHRLRSKIEPHRVGDPRKRFYYRMNRIWSFLLVVSLFAVLGFLIHDAQAAAPTIRSPKTVISGLPAVFSIESSDLPPESEVRWSIEGIAAGTATINQEGLGFIPPVTLPSGKIVVTVETAQGSFSTAFRVIPAWTTILPPLVAIVFAFLLREVLVSLTLGILVGTFLLTGYSPVSSALKALSYAVTNACLNRDHVINLLFTLGFGGFSALIMRNGGTSGMVGRVTRVIRSRRRGQLSAWMSGFIVFFDDYANTTIVGPTVRPLTDRLRISREKLAYIVDSTSAPVASIALISTWIGFELTVLQGALESIGPAVTDHWSPFGFFIETIPYRFYSILALVFGLLVAIMGRDFGPMLAAERRAVARKEDEPISTGGKTVSSVWLRVVPAEETPQRWWNAVVPIVVVLMTTACYLVWSGRSGLRAEGVDPSTASLREILNSADVYVTMLIASISGSLVALLMSVAARIFSVRHGAWAWLMGARGMLPAMFILILAWSIGDICRDLRMSEVTTELARGVLSPHIIPAVIFCLAAATSFATGTSFGTMSVLVPIAVPLAYQIGTAAGLDQGHLFTITLSAGGSVLAGAIFGDHCSPISDTTILSSMMTQCDLMAHVRTQLPYALVVAVVGTLCGDLPSGFDVSPWISLTIATVVFVGVLFLFGRPPTMKKRK